MVKLHVPLSDNSVQVQQLQDGEIAVITQWGTSSGMVGRIIQRCGNGLVTLGEGRTHRWYDVFGDYALRWAFESCYRIRILPKGTLLEV